MYKQIWRISAANFRRWRRNPQIILVFLLALVVSFLLSNKVVIFAAEHETELEFLEPFIWTFGDADSILIMSLLLLLLFADMPNLGNEVPLFLVRTNRIRWMLGQIVYMVLATLSLVTFILISTCVLAGRESYLANLWSTTAATLGYSNIGEAIAVPSFVKVMELSFPYGCALHIFGLMLGYSVMLASIILFLNLFRSKGGMIGGIVFSCFGFIMNQDMLMQLLHIPQESVWKANILFGWISPLNHATYYMHNFGYDNLPRLWQSYVFFSVGSAVFFGLAVLKSRRYGFDFTGTQR